MKRMIAFVLAVTLVTVGVPALAHDAAYESECEQRYGQDRCKATPEGQPAHRKCTGERNHMDASEDSLLRKPVDLADTEEESVTAYAHVADDATQTEMDADGTLVPGVVWIESNGFDGLQREDWECKSHAHEDPSAWEGHADQVLI